MPLMPKRVKYRKSQRGSRAGTATRTISIDFGSFALQTLERAWITNTQIEAARVALLETVREGDHLDVEGIAAGVRDRVGHISLQAVYEAVHALTKAGLVRRIEPAGSPARFEGRVGDNHHHLVCRNCGAVKDVDCAVGHPPCLDPVDDAGYLIDEADVTFWGLCPRCREQAG